MPGAIVHSEGEEEEDEDEDVDLDGVASHVVWPTTNVTQTLAESVLSPTSQEGDGTSQHGSSSGLSSLPSSGSLCDPHLLKSSPSSDQIPRQPGSQISEDPTSQSHSLYETAESLPDDSESGLDPFLVHKDPSVSSSVNNNSGQFNQLAPQTQGHYAQANPAPLQAPPPSALNSSQVLVGESSSSLDSNSHNSVAGGASG